MERMQQEYRGSTMLTPSWLKPSSWTSTLSMALSSKMP